jgi:hypothetical protein
MLTTNPAEIIGKILIAQNPIKVYRNNATSVNDYFSIIPVGKEVGKVDSFTGGSNGIPVIYKFVDNNNLPFFAIDDIGAFIIKKASIKKYFVFLAIAAGSYFIYKKFAKSKR